MGVCGFIDSGVRAFKNSGWWDSEEKKFAAVGDWDDQMSEKKKDGRRIAELATAEAITRLFDLDEKARDSAAPGAWLAGSRGLRELRPPRSEPFETFRAFEPCRVPLSRL